MKKILLWLNKKPCLIKFSFRFWAGVCKCEKCSCRYLFFPFLKFLKKTNGFIGLKPFKKCLQFDVEMARKYLNCVCGYFGKKETFIMVFKNREFPVPIYLSDEQRYYSNVFACPKCGTLKVELPK
jgi:hypothetical protein